MANLKLEGLEGALEATFKQFGNGASLFNGGVSATNYLADQKITDLNAAVIALIQVVDSFIFLVKDLPIVGNTATFLSILNTREVIVTQQQQESGVNASTVVSLMADFSALAAGASIALGPAGIPVFIALSSISLVASVYATKAGINISSANDLLLTSTSKLDGFDAYKDAKWIGSETFKESFYKNPVTLPILALMYEVDSSITPEEALSYIENSGSKGIFNGRIEESSNLLNSLVKIFFGGETGNLTTQEAIHTKLNEVWDAFKFVNGQYSFTTSPVNGAEARNDLGKFLSLYYLAPFSIVPVDAGAMDRLYQLHAVIADKWNADRNLSPEKIANGEANFSDKWLADRAAMVAALIQTNKDDIDYANAASNPFIDKSLNIQINAGAIHNAPSVIFGSINDENITGGLENDHLYGMGGDDELYGNEGDDYIEGNAGDDQLDGGKGKDTLVGGANNDTLNGGEGNDQLRGGQGVDIYQFTGNFGTDTITDSDGLGLIRVGANLQLDGGTYKATNLWESADHKTRYTIYTNPDNTLTLNIILEDGKKIFVKNWVNGQLNIDLQAAPIVTPNTPTNGTSADDYLLASGNILDGLAGNDVMVGSAMADTLRGDSGADILFGNQGEDTLEGGDNNDYLDGGAGQDTIFGGAGNDLINSISNYRDISIHEQDVNGNWQQMSNTSENWAKIAQSWAWNFTAGSAGDRLRYSSTDLSFSAGWTASDPNFGFKNPLGEEASDHSQGDIIYAGDGNDAVLGSSGNDYISGDAGMDVLVGFNGDDIIIAGADNDEVSGGTGNDLINGGAGEDDLFGGYGEDVIYGGSGNDQIVGDLTALAGTNPSAPPPSTDFSLMGDDVLDGGAGNDHIWGGGGADTIYGGDDDDELSGDGIATPDAYSGIDYIEGGGGNDKIWGYGKGDILLGGEGNDTIEGDSGNIADSENGDDYIEGGAGNDYLVGQGGNDTIYGGTGDDQLFGDGDSINIAYHGNDYLDGGAGNDILQGYGGTDTLIGGDGADQLFGYDGNDRLQGDAGDDYLNGGDGDDVLDGGMGQDTILGGVGNDILHGGGDGDILVGQAGLDVFYAGAGDLIADQEDGENINLLGSSTASSVGVNLNTTFGSTGISVDIEEGVSVNVANGLIASGNAFYTFQDGTTIKHSDLLGNNLDSVVNLYLTAPMGFGGKLNDSLIAVGNGNSTLFGGLGNDYLETSVGDDILVGGAGTDRMLGGEGDDTYYIDNLGDIVIEEESYFGTDTIVSSISNGNLLAYGVENLILTGSARLGNGNSLNNIMTGNDQDNTLAGGLGADTMRGKEGNDDYWVDNLQDLVLEEANQGFDFVWSSITYTLTDNVETLALIGSFNINGTGNELDNYLGGNDGDNVLVGGAGNDTLAGNFGQDLLIGGLGDDTYYLNTPFTGMYESNVDEIFEDFDAGYDYVYAGLNISLTANIERLQLVGDENINGTGNELDNYLEGNDSDNVLSGGIGNDTLDGWAGNDILIGGSGSDTYICYEGMGNEVIDNSANDGAVAIDIIEFQGISSDNVLLNRVANDLLITLTEADSVLIKNYFTDINNKIDQIIFKLYDDDNNVIDTVSWDTTTIESFVTFSNHAPEVSGSISPLTATDGSAINFVLPVATLFADADPNDALTYIVTLADGNPLPAWLAYESATYTLSGTPDPTHIGNLSLRVVATDLAGATAGIDFDLTVAAMPDQTITGTTANDLLVGGSGNDTLDGLAGTDTMTGGYGNDTYFVERATDKVIEQANQGIDTINTTVTYTASANVENLTLLGTASITANGNELNNALTGNIGNNTIDGKAGADSMLGGLGNDTYVVDDAGDVVTELENEGTDTVKSSVDYSLGEHVERLTLTGTTAINATGNGLNNILIGNDIDNQLVGGEGNDNLNGGLGADTLIGGLGNDTYVVENVLDTVIEQVGEGTDTVQASVTYTLAADVENLTLTGTSAINGTGNDLNNTLTGNAVDNQLSGGAGNDSLNGGLGADTLLGGLGNDIYTVDNANDVVIELAGEGIDRVNSSIDYTLGAEVENLTLTGAVAISASGNELNNTLTGNAADNVLIGNAGNDNLNGGVGADTMFGGLDNDIYTVDNINDVVVELVDEGVDRVNSSVSYTLGDNLENLTLTGAMDIMGFGNNLANVLAGNAGNNYLYGLAANDTITGNNGYDILQGGDDNDTISGNAGNGLLDGGSGNDRLTGGLENDLITGGAGSDTIITGVGYDVISFNKGDGQDIVSATTGADNTLSLGGNFAYSDLSLTKTGINLILKMGATDQITFSNWYSTTSNNKSVVNLQVITEAMQGFSLGGSDDLRNNKVETFNFTNLVAAFDAAGASANWQLTDARLTAHLQAGSDAAAIGGDLAYQYGKNSNLTGMGLLNAQSVINNANFGQTAQTLNDPSVWQAELVKLA